jgi:hypothetical protein
VGIYVGNPSSIVQSGKLIASGVTFTSYRDDTLAGDTEGDGATTGQPGDWYYIYFHPYSDPTYILQNCTIMYAGYNNNIAVYHSQP